MEVHLGAIAGGQNRRFPDLSGARQVAQSIGQDIRRPLGLTHEYGQTALRTALGLLVTSAAKRAWVPKKLRLQDGSLRIVPNGALTEFTNFSVGWGRAIVEVAVPRDVDVDRALALLRRVGEEWARETGAALDAPAVEGIMRFSGGDAVLRLAVRVDAARRLEAENDLRRRIKAAFDREQLSAVGV